MLTYSALCTCDTQAVQCVVLNADIAARISESIRCSPEDSFAYLAAIQQVLPYADHKLLKHWHERFCSCEEGLQSTDAYTDGDQQWVTSVLASHVNGLLHDLNQMGHFSMLQRLHRKANSSGSAEAESTTKHSNLINQWLPEKAKAESQLSLALQVCRSLMAGCNSFSALCKGPQPQDDDSAPDSRNHKAVPLRYNTYNAMYLWTTSSRLL